MSNYSVKGSVVRTKVDGRPATVSYLTYDFIPTTALFAQLIKVHFEDDDSVSFLTDSGHVRRRRLYQEIRALMNLPLFLMRHGETQDDVDGKWSGWDAVPLTDEGVRIVQAAAKAIAPLCVRRIVCSHVYRAKQTAQLCADILGNVPVVEDRRLAPWKLGILEKQVESDDKIRPYIEEPYVRVPGGESLFGYKTRLVAGMMDVETQNKLVGPTLIISHSSGVCVWEGGGDIAKCSGMLQPASVAMSNGYGEMLTLVHGSMSTGDAA